MVPKSTKKSSAKATAVRKTKTLAAKTTKKQSNIKEETVEDSAPVSNGLVATRKSKRNLAKSTLENNAEIQIETITHTAKGKKNPPRSLKKKNNENIQMETDENLKAETEETSKVETDEISKVENDEMLKIETSEISKVETDEKVKADETPKGETDVKPKSKKNIKSKVEKNTKLKIEADNKPKGETDETLKIETDETLKIETDEILIIETDEMPKVDTDEMTKAETNKKSKVDTDKKSKIKANKKGKSELEEESIGEKDAKMIFENMEGINIEDKSDDIESESKDVKPKKNTRPYIKIIKEDNSKKSKAKEAKTQENKLEENDAKKPRLDENKEVRKLPSRKRKADIQINEVDNKNIKLNSSSKVKSQPAMISKAKKVLLEIPPLKSKLGTVFVIGQNDVGQLGLSENVDVKTRPCPLELPHSIVDIAAGGMHSLCLTESGEVLTFGCNDEGALGRVTADETEEFTPFKVNIPERVIQVSAGDSHSAALTESGQVYIWGNFRSGEGPLGLTPSGLKQVTPITILNGIKIVKISSGNEHLVCLSAEGEVYTCGCGEQGQLGRITGRSCKKGGRKGLAALLEPAVVSIMNARKKILADDIWTGSDSTFIKAQDTGEIYAFGLNNYNQLGFINENNQYSPKHVTSFDNIKWLQISGGEHHTLALDSKGHVYALGRKEYGRLGLGEDCEDKSLPTIIPALQKEKCIDISCGTRASFAVAEQGSAYSWGFGTTNQLGHGNDNDCHEPCIIGGNLSQSWKSLQVSGGGQHTLILACQKKENKT